MFPPPSDQIGPRPPRTKLEHFRRAESISSAWENFELKQILNMDQQVSS